MLPDAFGREHGSLAVTIGSMVTLAGLLLAVAVLLWIGYVALFVLLGAIPNRAHQTISIDTGAARADESGPASAIVHLLRDRPALVGGPGPDRNVVVRGAGGHGGVACFRIIADGDRYLVEVRRSADGWTVAGLLHHGADGRWTPVLAGDASICRRIAS